MPPAVAVAKPPIQPAPKRMALSAVRTGKRQCPPRILVYGTPGIGKSTLASKAPSPIWIGAEDGVSELDVASFPEPSSWNEILEAVDTLTNDKHDFQTVVLDTADWMEPLNWAFCCSRDGKRDIEDYGYGKGYTAALGAWLGLLARLDKLRNARGMNVVILAHSWVRTFNNPSGDDFDRYELKLNQKASGAIIEWSDAVLFACYEQFVRKLDSGKTKAVSSGARLLHTERNAAWEAKNRYCMPPTIALEWDDVWSSIRRGEEPAVFLARIESELEGVEDESLAEKVRAFVGKAGNDTAKLAQALNRLSAIKNGVTCNRT